MKMNILNIGISEIQPDWLRQKIKITNVLILVIAAICLFFAVISLIYLKPIAYLPIAAFFIVLFSFVLNAIGLHKTSRYLLISVPFVLSIIYNASISNATNAPLYALWGLTITFSIPIFILFDYRELSYSVAGFIVMLLFISFFDIINATFNEEGIDYEFATGIFFTLLCIVASFAVTFSALLFQQILFRDAELKNFNLINNLNAKQDEAYKAELEIKNTLSELQVEKEKDEQRSKISMGIAGLGTILRNESSLNNLYDNILSYLVKFLNANQAGLYTLEVDNDNIKYLNLQSAFAYERKKFIERKIEIGEGLVGQCYIEGEKIILTEIPNGYTKITSGLGESTPKFLSVFPLKYNEKIEGVLEVASFQILKEYEIDFLEKACESIAGFIKNVKVNEETKNLLELSNQQAAQLKEAEEEMRQNLEEMQTTIEEAQRKEIAYLDKIQKLEKGE